MLAATSDPNALWYLTRATGAVTLLLLTVSLVLGIANAGRLQRPGWPRFVIEGIHRNVSLLSIVLLAVHIVTSLLDPFAGIRVIDAFVPLSGSYRPLWLGFGALASDLLIAVALTSVLRRRFGHSLWRAVHWLAYLCWPVAVLHTVGTGSDVGQVWLLTLTAVCVAAVVVSVWVRIGLGWPAQRRLRGAAAAASIALPAAFLVWLPSGPLASGWAKRAGTPAALLASSSAAGRSSSEGAAPRTVTAFQAAVSGTITQNTTAGGLAVVDIALNVGNATLPKLAVQITGNNEGDGVAMTASTVSAGTLAAPDEFSGEVTSLSGTDIEAQVSGGGRTLSLRLALQIASGSVSGTIELTPTR
ncbi:MAG TPA: ferric reductase-like transmembrane domain-containing protein [Solirubrobacteraceae bacterium]|jgi:DMSO/TMAO reductase YedYZ heme-binding membrane subunit